MQATVLQPSIDLHDCANTQPSEEKTLNKYVLYDPQATIFNSNIKKTIWKIINIAIIIFFYGFAIFSSFFAIIIAHKNLYAFFTTTLFIIPGAVLLDSLKQKIRTISVHHEISHLITSIQLVTLRMIEDKHINTRLQKIGLNNSEIAKLREKIDVPKIKNLIAQYESLFFLERLKPFNAPNSHNTPFTKTSLISRQIIKMALKKAFLLKVFENPYEEKAIKHYAQTVNLEGKMYVKKLSDRKLYTAEKIFQTDVFKLAKDLFGASYQRS